MNKEFEEGLVFTKEEAEKYNTLKALKEEAEKAHIVERTAYKNAITSILLAALKESGMEEHYELNYRYINTIEFKHKKDYHFTIDVQYGEYSFADKERKLSINPHCYGQVYSSDIGTIQYFQFVGFLANHLAEIESKLSAIDPTAYDKTRDEMMSAQYEYEKVVRCINDRYIEERNTAMKAKLIVGCKIKVGDMWVWNKENTKREKVDDIKEIVKETKAFFTLRDIYGYETRIHKDNVYHPVLSGKWKIVE